MEDMIRDELVGENDICKFYKNSFTETSTHYANRVDPYKNMALTGWRVLIAEQKSNRQREYILLDDELEIVDSNFSFEGIGVCIDKFLAIKQYNVIHGIEVDWEE